MKLACELAGPTNDKTPLVLLHAFPLNRRMWTKQVEHFSTSRRVLALDLRGYGESAVYDGQPFGVADYANDLRETLAELDVLKAVFVGCSMGGYTIFELWRQNPSLFAGMVLADTRAEPDNEETRAKREKQIQQIQQTGAGWMPDFVSTNLLSPYTRENRREIVAQVRDMTQHAAPGVLVHTLQMLRDRPDSGPTLRTINVSCLVLVGEDDQVTPRPLSERMQQDIEGAEMEIVAKAGHLSPLENPAAFNSRVDEFLSSAGL